MKIPATILQNKVVHLPPAVILDYSSILRTIGRYNDACGPSPAGEIGGNTYEATYNHFVHRFAASAVRTEYLLLGPTKEINETSKDLMQSLNDGAISILDVPCGTGAGLLGLLGLLHELRLVGSVKRLPLNISVTAGDSSQEALDLYTKMLNAATSWLAEQGIRLQWECHNWDAKQESSTASIVDAWFTQSPHSEEWIVLIAAFSGELASAEEKINIETNSRFFQHICSRMHDRFGGIYWIEPLTNESKWLIPRILESVANSISSTFRRRHNSDGVAFRWQHPLKNKAFNSGIRVLEHRRTRIE